MDASTMEFTYPSASRAIALVDRPPRQVVIDGEDAPVTLFLPRGQHVVAVTCGSPRSHPVQ
jgi:hypothetical protein